MIRYVCGNLLDAQVEALVNAVNTVGVMGKGIALAFKQRFELNYRLYVAACRAREVRIGRMFVTETVQSGGPRWIVNFPTKQHWRQPSHLQWITDGLDELRHFTIVHELRSIAVPALGVGLGGLEWPSARQLIERTMGDLDAEVLIYEPLTQD